MKENRRKILLVMGQAVALYTVYAVVSFFACYLLQTTSFDNQVGNEFWSRRLYFQVGYIYGTIAFFSLASVFTLYDSALWKRFSEARTRSLIGSFVLLVTDRFVWIRGAVLGILAALFHFLPPHYLFHAAFVMSKGRLEAWLLGALSVALFVAVYLLAVLSTLSWWNMAPRKHVESKSGMLSFLFQLGYTSVLWVIGGTVLALVAPLTSGFFKLAYRYFVLFLAVGIAAYLTYAVIRYGCVMWQRRRLLRGLARECERQGLSLEVDGHPYLELLYRTRACTVTVWGREIAYVCRFVGGMQAKNPLYLREDGEAEYTRFYIWWSHVITERYFFETDEDAKKILLICPSWGKLFAKDGEAERELFTGDRTMEYTVYTGQDFLNALKRNCV